jgi:hypothetical protein
MAGRRERMRKDGPSELERWRAIDDATGAGILVVDRDKQVSAVNQRYLDMWRIARAAGGHLDLVAPALRDLEDPELFLRRTREVYAHPDADTGDVFRFKDGRAFEIVSGPQVIGGEIVGRVWTCRDVSAWEHLLRRWMFLADAGRLLASLDIDQALDAVAHLAVPHLGHACAIRVDGDDGPARSVSASGDPGPPFDPDLHPEVRAGRSATYEAGGALHLGIPLVVKGRPAGALTLADPTDRDRARDREHAALPAGAGRAARAR